MKNNRLLLAPWLSGRVFYIVLGDDIIRVVDVTHIQWKAQERAFNKPINRQCSHVLHVYIQLYIQHKNKQINIFYTSYSVISIYSAANNLKPVNCQTGHYDMLCANYGVWITLTKVNRAPVIEDNVLYLDRERFHFMSNCIKHHNYMITFSICLKVERPSCVITDYGIFV